LAESDGELTDSAATRVDLPKPAGEPHSERASASSRAPSSAREQAADEPRESVPPLEPLSQTTTIMPPSGRRFTLGLSDPTSISTSSTIVTHDVVEAERTARTRAGLVGIVVVASVSVVLLQLSQVATRANTAVSISLAVLAVLAVVRRVQLSGKTNDPSIFLSMAVAAACALVAVSAVTYVGILTSVAMSLPVIVFVLAQSDHAWHARVPYLLCAGGYFIVVVLTLTGVFDESLVHVVLKRQRGILLLGLFGEAILAVAYVLGRRYRKETLNAMERLERARREILGRQALLDEARAELEEALGAGKVGRLTGRRVGRWTAQEVIGRGGMGEVYRALDDAGQAAALKVLHDHMQEDQQQLERFFREAKISSDLCSPHIVTVLDSGSDGSPYLAMELLTGYDLAELLRRQQRLRLRDAVELVSHVASALTVAQDAGIVHRDLKPQNIFRAGSVEGGIWKVLDFGVSKIVDAGATLTRDALVGTPSYMSPEQAQGLTVDHRSDVFSLGAIAYRALTGRPAFHAGEPLVALHNVVHAMPARPSELVKLPDDVDLALALVLTKDPARRFRSAASFAAALHDASRGELDERLREDARRLLAEAPWGSVQRHRASMRPPAPAP
jgi:serine/threonine-protein kinase